MYLEDRDIDKTMDIYFSGWKKGLKSTYYLHMKPRHTAEQSTVAVNKSAKLGKTGFASVFKTTDENRGIEKITVSGGPLQTVVHIEESFESTTLKDTETIIEDPEVTDEKKPLVIPVDESSKQIFSNVQTQIPLNEIPLSTETVMNTEKVENIEQTQKSVEPKHQHYQEKIIDGKVYKIHMPSDPQENFTCDGCQ